jgi:hypothetical protein
MAPSKQGQRLPDQDQRLPDALVSPVRASPCWTASLRERRDA